MLFTNSFTLAALVPLLLTLALTPLVRYAARRWSFVAAPNADRWHKKPTAMFGGVAIFLSVVAGYLLFVPPTPQGFVLLGASAFLFAIGLVDDLLHIKPYQKLIGQILGASVVIYFGMVLPWTPFNTFNIVITLFWLLGVTNAINLLDNMDGLATGTTAIAAAFLAFNFVQNGDLQAALILIVFIAALIGFLAYNSNPASIFMGDCGSMFIGFYVAGSALLGVEGGRSRSLAAVLLVPVLILFVPIFDTTFVTIIRKLSGRAASQGGRDHTSHRLVALGMSERRAVWMLYGLATASGLIALFARNASVDVSIAVIIGFAIGLTLLGVYLAKVKVYEEAEINAMRQKPLYAFLIDLSYKRRLFEVLLDVALILLSYYGAHVLLFGAFADTDDWRLFARTLPLIILIKMSVFLATGVYRGIWRYTGINDLAVIARAVFISTVVCVLAFLFTVRFTGFSRTLFVLDGMFLMFLIAGSRLTFRMLAQLLPNRHKGEGRRVLIYGAGDAGELLLRELLNNRELSYVPVGFVDDDPTKVGKVIHGLRVFNGNGNLQNACREHDVEEVLLSTTRLHGERLEQLRNVCDASQIVLKRMRIEIETLNGDTG